MSSTDDQRARRLSARQRGLSWAGAVALLLASAAPAAAHLGNISYSDVSIEGAGAVYRFKFAAHRIPGARAAASGKLSRQEVLARKAELVAWLARTIHLSSGGKLCEPSVEAIIGPDHNDDLQVISAYGCAAPIETLRLSFRAFDATVPDYQNIASVRLGDQSWSFVFKPGTNVLRIGEEPDLIDDAGEAGDGSGSAIGSESVAGQFLGLGFAHILQGYDHLAFLLALLLLGGTIGHLAGIVTAFTVAHSITLSLAVLGVITLPPRAVEIAIALSIMFVAAENLVHEKSDHRWIATFAFGLVHGFGFAGVLAESGLPSGSMFVPLLCFNLGVEAGQLLVVAVVIPLLALLLRGRRRRRGQLVLSVAIFLLAGYWLVERVAPLF